MNKNITLLFVCLILTLNGISQKRALSFEGLEGVKIEYSKVLKDSLELRKEVNSVLSQLYSLSYLTATVDTVVKTEQEVTVRITKGQAYKWLQLSKGNIPEAEASEIDLSGRLFLNRSFNANQLNKLFERTIKYYENRGYPFASVELDSLDLNKTGEISAALKVERNKFYKIDSILIRGKTGVSDAYLLNYLGIKPEVPYNEGKIKAIETRIQEIPFIKQTKKSEIQFFEEGVKIILTLEKKKASRFDGIIGLLTSEENGKIELTGDVDLELINSFNRGEGIGLNWRKLKGNSQDLQLSFLYPYLFKSQFGVDFDFKLFKRDTTFIDLTTRLGISYLLERGESVSLFLENKSSSLLSRSSFINQTDPSVPSLGDVRVNSFGIAYTRKRTDYKYNPTRGLNLFTTFSAGKKRLEPIKSLQEENPNLYNGVDLTTNQYNGKIDVELFIPINLRNTIKFGNKSAGIYSENIYQNELLRIGGLKILRGFDEESINVSTYSIFTLEYRFLLDRNSYFSLFSDGGYYENNNVETYINDTPFGIGAGISFETKAGIFTFNYAVGKQFDNPIQLRAAKVHFGFINFF